MNPVTESSMATESLVDHRSSELNGSPIDQPLNEDAEQPAANKSAMRWLVRILVLAALLWRRGLRPVQDASRDPGINTP